MKRPAPFKPEDVLYRCTPKGNAETVFIRNPNSVFDGITMMYLRGRTWVCAMPGMAEAAHLVQAITRLRQMLDSAKSAMKTADIEVRRLNNEIANLQQQIAQERNVSRYVIDKTVNEQVKRITGLEQQNAEQAKELSECRNGCFGMMVNEGERVPDAIRRWYAEFDAVRSAQAKEIARLKAERGYSLDREFLGKLVRHTWVQWAEQQPDSKPSWLVPWEKLDEAGKEVDRLIGEAVANICVSPHLLLAEQEIERLKRNPDCLVCMKNSALQARVATLEGLLAEARDKQAGGPGISGLAFRQRIDKALNLQSADGEQP